MIQLFFRFIKEKDKEIFGTSIHFIPSVIRDFLKEDVNKPIEGAFPEEIEKNG